MSIIALVACGGAKKQKGGLTDEERQKALDEAKAYNDAQQAERKAVNPENLEGKWEIVGSTPKSAYVGKIIEFTPDSIFHYNEKGPVHDMAEYKPSEEKINIWHAVDGGTAADNQTIYFQGDTLIFVHPLMLSFKLVKK